MNIYWAAPLFTAAERRFNDACAALLRGRGHRTHLPQDEPPSFDPSEVYERCAAAIRGSEVVVACLDGPDPDSGTSWEVGYAVGIGKPVVAFRTDDRLAELPDMGRCNLMLTQSPGAFVTCDSAGDLRFLCDALADAVAKVVAPCS